MSDRPSVYEYTAHGAFIDQMITWMRGQHNHMSTRWLARRLGVSNGTISKITNGKGRLSEDHAPHLAELLKLSPEETEYFELLVAKDSAATSAAREALERAVTGRRRVERATAIGPRQSSCFDNWLGPTVRELLTLHPDADAATLCQLLEPSPSEEEVVSILAELERAGLLPSQDGGSASSGHESDIGRAYHEQMIELGIRSLSEIPWQDRFVNGFTASVSEEGYAEMKARIRELIEVMYDHCEKDVDADRVVQLNVQLFPLSTYPKAET